MKNTKRIALLISVFVCISQSGYCIKLSALRDEAEEILYGSEHITNRFLEKALKEIDQPEANPFSKVGPRTREKAIEVIKAKKENLEESISVRSRSNSDSDSISSSASNPVQDARLHDLLSLLSDESDFAPVPLSFLLEEICAQHN